MAWFKVDDRLFGHPKWMKCHAVSHALWVSAGSWSAAYLTDGRVPSDAVTGPLRSTADAAAGLVDAGLWIDNRDGSYQFKDWFDYQPARADLEAGRKAARQRQSDWRERRKNVTPDVTPDVTRESHDPQRRVTSPAHARAFTHTHTHTKEKQPQPPSGVVRAGARTRPPATRIPADFTITDTMRTWAAANAPAVDLARATERFVDHWTAKAGRDAVKLDWTATWRNWIRRDNDQPPRNATHRRANPDPPPPVAPGTQRAQHALTLADQYRAQEATDGTIRNGDAAGAHSADGLPERRPGDGRELD